MSKKEKIDWGAVGTLVGMFALAIATIVCISSCSCEMSKTTESWVTSAAKDTASAEYKCKRVKEVSASRSASPVVTLDVCGTQRTYDCSCQDDDCKRVCVEIPAKR